MICPECQSVLVLEDGDDYRPMYIHCQKACGFEIDVEDVPLLKEGINSLLERWNPQQPNYLAVWWHVKKTKDIAEAEARNRRITEQREKSLDEEWRRRCEERQRFHEQWQKMSYFERVCFRIHKEWLNMWESIDDQYSNMTREQYIQTENAKMEEIQRLEKQALERSLHKGRDIR